MAVDNSSLVDYYKEVNKIWQVVCVASPQEIPVAKNKKIMGVQQILLSPNDETKALLEYLCQQSGKLYNNAVYFARQTFFKTGKLLTSKFDLIYEESISKSLGSSVLVMQSQIPDLTHKALGISKESLAYYLPKNQKNSPKEFFLGEKE
jgi:hypothetical protein